MERKPESGGPRMTLLDDVALLHPEEAVFEAMLKGWADQQIGGRGLQRKTVADRMAVVRRFMEGTNEYPWTWSAGHLDEWTSDLVSAKRVQPSTIRTYQGAVRLFCDYITSPYYQWPMVCERDADEFVEDRGAFPSRAVPHG